MMFHLLFVPCYLDYEQTGLGGYLGLSSSCLEGLFHFTACLPRPPHKSIALPVILTLLVNAVASYRRPKSLFSLPFHPSTLPSFLYLALLRRFCSPLFCVDIKLLSACIFVCLQCAGHRVLLSLVYRQVLWECGCDYPLRSGLCTFCI